MSLGMNEYSIRLNEGNVCCKWENVKIGHVTVTPSTRMRYNFVFLSLVTIIIFDFFSI